MVHHKTPLSLDWRTLLSLDCWLVMTSKLDKPSSKLHSWTSLLEPVLNLNHVCPITIWATMTARTWPQRNSSSPNKPPNQNASRISSTTLCCMILDTLNNILITLLSSSMSLLLVTLRKLLTNTPVRSSWEVNIPLSATMSVKTVFWLLVLSSISLFWANLWPEFHTREETKTGANWKELSVSSAIWLKLQNQRVQSSTHWPDRDHALKIWSEYSPVFLCKTTFYSDTDYDHSFYILLHSFL